MDGTFLAQLIVNGLVVGSIYALVATGFVIIHTSSGALNLAQGEFLMAGAYISLVLTVQAGLPIPLAFLLTLLFMGMLGALIERAVLRPLLNSPVISAIMVTLGLSSVMRASIQLFFGTDTRPFPELFPALPVMLGPLPVSQGYLASAIGSALLLGGLTFFFRYTRTGLAMRATAADRQAARSMGISVGNMFALAWCIAAVVSAIGGILLGATRGGIDMSLGHMGLKVLPVVILGGLDSVAGAVVGGLLIGLLESLAGGYLDPLLGGGVKEVVPYMILVLILMVKPAGLLGARKVERA